MYEPALRNLLFQLLPSKEPSCFFGQQRFHNTIDLQFGLITTIQLTSTLIDIIDAKNQEIRPQDGEVYSKMEDLADDLPESSPRFILLSHPLTLVSSEKLLGLINSLRTLLIQCRVSARAPVVSPSLTSFSTICPKTATLHNE